MNTYKDQHAKAKPGHSLVGVMFTSKTGNFEYDVRFKDLTAHESPASHVIIIDSLLAELVR